MDSDKEKTVVLQSFDNLMEAEIVCGKLRDNGIECFLSDVNTAILAPFYLEKIAGIRLFVLESDLEKAGEILKEDTSLPNED